MQNPETKKSPFHDLKVGRVAVLVGLASLVVFLMYRPASPPTLPKAMVPSTPEPKVRVADSESKTTATSSQPPVPAAESAKMKIAQPQKNSHVLCLREKKNIFYLPREIALPLTRLRYEGERQNMAPDKIERMLEGPQEIVLPKEFAQCLRPGSWDFWVVDFDQTTWLPYRYYFTIRTHVQDVKATRLNLNLTSQGSISEANRAMARAFGHLPDDIEIQNLTVRGLEFVDFRMGWVNTDRLPLAEPITVKPLADASVLQIGSLPESMRTVLSQRFMPPSDLIYGEWRNVLQDTHATLVAENQFDLDIHNLSLLYFLKFNRMPSVYMNSMGPGAPSSQVSYEYVTLQDFMRNPQGYMVVDTRAQRVAAGLRVSGSYQMNFETYGANSLNTLINRFRAGVRFVEIYQSMSDAIPSLRQAAMADPGKTLLFMGYGGRDPLVRMIVRNLDASLQARAKILSPSFHELLIYSYFFSPTGFVSAGGTVDLPRGMNIEPYLGLGFHKPKILKRDIRQHSQPNH